MLLKKIAFSSVLLFVLRATTVYGADAPDLSKDVVPTTFAMPSSPLITADEDPNLYDQLGPTLALMKMFLRDDFKPLPAGLKDDVRTFFSSEKYNPHERFFADIQRIEYDEELGNILCELIRNEQRQAINGNVTLYHGLTGDLLFTYRYLAEFFTALTGQDMGKFVLRGDHLYAGNPETGAICQNMKEIREIISKKKEQEHACNMVMLGDYDYGIDTMTMHCNIALSVGPNTSQSTASSVGFMCQSYNAQRKTIFDIIYSSLIFQGMSIIDAKKSAREAEALFNTFFGDQTKKNGGILAISMPLKIADDLALHVGMGGSEYTPTAVDFSVSDNSSISYLLQNLQKATTLPMDDNGICQLTNEISLYLHPQAKMDIIGFHRHMLPSVQQAKLDSDLQKLATSHAQMILTSKTKPIDGAFLTPRRTKPAESAQYQIETIPFLLERGEVALAQKIAAQNPKFFEDESIKKMLIPAIVKALTNGFVSSFDFIEQVSERSFFSLVPPNHLPLIVGVISQSGKKEAWLKLVSADNIPETLLMFALSTNPCFFSPADVFYVFLEKHHLNQQQIEDVILHHCYGCYNVKQIEEVFSVALEHGFSLNPNEPDGKNRLDKWLGIWRKHRCPITTVTDVIKHYGLSPENARELYVLLANELDNDDFNKDIVGEGRKIEVGDFKTIIKFDEMDTFHFGYNFSSDHPDYIANIAKHMSKRLHRMYSPELIKAFLALQESIAKYGRITISFNIPENHKWLDELKKSETLDEAKKSVNELDDLNILLVNLHLLDSKFGESAVNKWFEEILAEYRTIAEKNNAISCNSNDEIKEQFHDMVQQGLPISLITRWNSVYSYSFAPQDVLTVWSRVWKYNSSGFLGFYLPNLEKDRPWVNTFLENEITRHPELLQNREFVLKLFQNEAIPSSLLNNRSKLKELFLMLGPQDCKNGTIRLLKSDNEALRSFAEEMYEEVCVPGMSLKEANGVLEDYGLIFDDEED